MMSFKWLTLIVTLILMFPLLLVYKYSYYFFAPFDEIHFSSTDETSDSYQTFLINTSTNPITRNSSILSSQREIVRTTAYYTSSKYGSTYSSIKTRTFSNLENDKNNDFYDTRWVKKLNYTIDYGDKTCEETKNGNPSKKIFVQLLQQWKQISKKYNIPYFIVYGSLIGAIRNADFIPWDHDMDLLVDESYYEIISKVDNNRNFTPSANDPNFHLVVQNNFRSDYSNMHKTRQNCLGQIVSSQTDQCAFNGPMARLILGHVQLDIFHYEHTEDGLLIDREMEYYDETAMTHNYSDIFPLKRCMYGGVEVKCPKHSLKFLKKVYGKDVLKPLWKCKNGTWEKTL